ncbi:MAG: hypothetical protein DRO13_06630 [Thermoprotei archaeon]|nr:MAG: hypothetical protein DRO13_06630 [Thermoprotei archaeon]
MTFAMDKVYENICVVNSWANLYFWKSKMVRNLDLGQICLLNTRNKYKGCTYCNIVVPVL